MAQNIQEKLTSAQASVFAQLAAKPNSYDSFSDGLKKNISKVGLMSFIAATVFISHMGNAEAGSKSDTFKVAAGISALIGVANNNNHSLHLPGVCDIRGVNGTKVAASTFLGSAVGSKIGGGNGTKAWMVALGLLGTNMSLNSENDRIYREMQECERKLNEMNDIQRQNSFNNVQIPQYLTTETNVNSIIFYSFPDKYGQQTFMGWDTSPALASMNGNGKGTDINKNKKAFAEFDKQLDNLKMSYNHFEDVSNRWIQLSNAQNEINQLLSSNVSNEDRIRLENTNGQTRQVMQQMSQAFENAYKNYILNRGNFMAQADAAVLEGFNLKEHKQSVRLLQIPQAAKNACQCQLTESHNSLNNEVTDRVKKRM